MIQNEIFDYLYNKLSGRATSARCAAYRQKRMLRARLALASQNYFLGTEYVSTGTIGEVGTDQTAPVERKIIIRGGGMNARALNTEAGTTLIDTLIGLVDLQIFRTGSSRAQISKDFLRSTAYVSDGQGQPWELDWPVPWTLNPNEMIQTRFTQITGTPLSTLYSVNFYGVAVDSRQCESGILEDMYRQICNSDQRPIYYNLKSEDSGGAIHFDAPGLNQVETILMEEAQEYLLVLGFRRNANDYLPGNTTFRLSGSDGRTFSREELVIKGFENYCTPDQGYFRFTVPHLIRKGRALTAHLTTDNASTPRRQFEGEINLLCVTV